MTESNEPRELLPCPDGHKTVTVAQWPDSENRWRHHGFCTCCGWRGPSAGSVTEAIAAWNHRTATEAASKQWRDAVEDALICAHLGTADSFPDAKTALHRLICWEVDVALDPRVSERARDLVAASAATVAELREALGALAFIDMGKDEDENAPFTTQEVWETIYRDRVQDWFSFEDFETARALLAKHQQGEGCPSCHGLNLSCPDGCGRDPLTGELNGTRL